MIISQNFDSIFSTSVLFVEHLTEFGLNCGNISRTSQIIAESSCRNFQKNNSISFAKLDGIVGNTGTKKKIRYIYTRKTGIPERKTPVDPSSGRHPHGMTSRPAGSPTTGRTFCTRPSSPGRWTTRCRLRERDRERSCVR